MNKPLNELNTLVNHIQDSMERENVLRDIDMMCLRIINQEYKNTDFLNRQDFDVLRRTHEFFNYLLGYHQQSLVWKEILSKIPLTTIHRTFDFCPGAAPKIEWGLESLNYQGELYIFDLDHIACEQIKLLLAILKISYPVYFIQNDIFLPFDKTADLITANHILDDLVLNYYCQLKGLNLRSLYASEEEFKSSVEKILDIELEFICDAFYKCVDQKLNSNGYFILAHYPSLTERVLNLSKWSDKIGQMMQTIYDLFVDVGYEPFMPLLMEKNVTYFILKKGNMELKKCS